MVGSIIVISTFEVTAHHWLVSSNGDDGKETFKERTPTFMTNHFVSSNSQLLPIRTLERGKKKCVLILRLHKNFQTISRIPKGKGKEKTLIWRTEKLKNGRNT